MKFRISLTVCRGNIEQVLVKTTKPRVIQMLKLSPTQAANAGKCCVHHFPLGGELHWTDSGKYWFVTGNHTQCTEALETLLKASA